MKTHEWLKVLDKKNYAQLSTINKAFNQLTTDFPEVFDEFEGLTTVRQLAVVALSNYGAEE